MAESSRPGEGRGHLSHHQYLTYNQQDPPRSRRREIRYPIGRSTFERADVPTDGARVPNDAQWVARTSSRWSTDDVPVQTFTEWETFAELPIQASALPDGDYTWSPPPIETYGEDEEESPRQRQFSYDRGNYGRRYKSRSRSPIHPRHKIPGREGYLSRDVLSRTAGYNGDWYSRTRGGSLSSNEYEPYDKFDFSSRAQSITDPSKADDSDAESPESEETNIVMGPSSLMKDESASNSRSQITLVHSSAYTGNAEMGGSHAAVLNLVHDPKGQKSPLFRWLHVPQDVMNFEDFWVGISRISGLTKLEKKAVTRLRADVKKSCVKSRTNSKGAKVGYLDPKYVEVPLKPLKTEAMSSSSVSGSARWICIPFFSLEQYSGLLAGTSTSLFPAQTLLQIQYSRNTVARDMEQAVVQLGIAERGECFHVSQLWCLVIDNSLIVTCGTMTRDDLLGQGLEITERPSRAVVNECNGRILVAYGDSFVWSFDADECQTWFAFLSKFQAFWPKVPEFWYKDQAVTANAWPRILKLASAVRAMSLKITMKLGSKPDPPPRAILRPDPQVLTSTHGGKGKPGTQEFAHMLSLATWDGRGPQIQVTGFKLLEAQLDAAETFLTCDTTYTDRKAYKTCKEASRKECYDYLVELSGRIEEAEGDSLQRAYEERVDIFNAVDIVYSFFLPMNFQGPMVGKFWGAVRSITELAMLDGRPVSDIAGSLRVSLRDLTRSLLALQNLVIHSSDQERAEVEMPPEFSKAWLYITMAIVYGSKDDPKCDDRMRRAEELIATGSKKLVQGFGDNNLLEKAIVLPLEVLSLITMGLLEDQVGKSDDICDTYSQYLGSLVCFNADNAITRLDLVQQELVAVKRTLWKQKSLIYRLRKSLTAIDTEDIVMSQIEHGIVLKEAEKQYNDKRYYSETLPPPHSQRQGEDYDRIVPVSYAQEVATVNDYMELDDDFLFDMASSSKLSPTDAGGLRGLFFLECSRLIEQREFEFRRFSDFSKDLERAITYKMDFTRDRQERAIYAFTLVTIIFLPISAVSSIFGMNTTDVRDMNYSQWLYWVVAIPVTVLVIVLGLWFMGELGNLARWLFGRPGKRIYGEPAVISQTVKPAYWAVPPTTQLGAQPAEYSSPPYEPRRRRVQTQANYPARQSRIYRSQ
ncbi:uncharacterized protein FFUJ_01259 [Fusarium fujikuroi IMI 58289]|uniref:Uncharacterized protein n=1 Tax=Gibberella fujikuroi (strain CBS 195.34 / IMI 58289 / NRRL A-6831) TaxID=1279085 RepID=S0DM69_GIBF5|nr:uncharacterized protein FFUJ_01259 [Fusarium fujikuroi IMI 58289]KLP22583.1 uncharacterized protein LW94_7113 [Fusarium fujikuroi]CCT63521.1 uncharacterized protein FFUJ_01259 [Fusarium fujikuroi IMI 58289]SCN75334.1 uncharacterized protein FFM5_01297 [Fusarium fujikuroi]SCO28193.1 uncharacterized protein FFMR_00888 [Fusarium fujikuroi]